MKKKFHKKLAILDSFQLLAVSLTFFLSFGATVAWGSADLDRQYDLASVGALRALDNMDGLFGEYVAAAFKEYFSKESRFVYNDLSKTDSILTDSKMPYSKVIYDFDILTKLARSTRTDSLIRTKVVKQETQYLFTLDWLHAPGMELLSSISFTLDQPMGNHSLGSDTINDAIGTHLTRLFLSIPFSANVSGRDQRSVTVNLGNHSSVQKGDTLVIGTLDAVKKHPLLRSVVDWQTTTVGKVQVDMIEDGMAFCHILSEEPGREIARSQKVVQVLATMPTVAPIEDTQPTEKKEFETIPRLGYVGVTALVGTNNRQYTDTTGPNNIGGTGLLLGGRAFGEIWLNREFFVTASFGYAASSFTQSDIQTQTQISSSGVSVNISTFRGEIGYAFLMNGDFFGPKGWVKLGYKSTSYSSQTIAAEFNGPMSIGSFIAGIGGEIPIRSKWGVRAEVDFRVLSSGSANWVSDTVNGAYDVDFFVGGYYRYNSRIAFRCGLDLVFSGIDFRAGTSIGQKVVTIGPSLLYYL